MLILGELELDMSSIKLIPRRKNMVIKVQERKLVLKEIKEQKDRKMKIEKEVKLLENEADSSSLEADKKGNIQTLSKANVLRAEGRSARTEELAVVNLSLSALEKVKVIG